MKLRPTYDNVIIRRSSPEDRSPGGLIIAASAQEKSMRGEVLAVGPGRHTESGFLIAPDLKPGDIVLVAGHYAGTEVELAGERYLIVRAGEVTAVVEP